MQNRLHDWVMAVREWPEHHRRWLALGLTTVITFVIAAGWAATLPGQMAALTTPVTTQPAAVELSVVTSPTNQGESATDILEKAGSTGSQFFNSLKSSFSGLFSNSGASTTNQVVITNQTNQNTSTVGTTSNPYSNLKYYVSHGVLITDPSPKK